MSDAPDCTVLKTIAVNFNIDKYPKILPFCEITPFKSHGKYWQKISENNKIHFCDPHKSCCIKCKNGHALHMYIDEGHGNLLLSLS